MESPSANEQLPPDPDGDRDEPPPGPQRTIRAQFPGGVSRTKPPSFPPFLRPRAASMQERARAIIEARPDLEHSFGDRPLVASESSESRQFEGPTRAKLTSVGANTSELPA